MGIELERVSIDHTLQKSVEKTFDKKLVPEQSENLWTLRSKKSPNLISRFRLQTDWTLWQRRSTKVSDSRYMRISTEYM